MCVRIDVYLFVSLIMWRKKRARPKDKTWLNLKNEGEKKEIQAEVQNNIDLQSTQNEHIWFIIKYIDLLQTSASV